jgi:transcriptional regulator with XRE-family HTH domain
MINNAEIKRLARYKCGSLEEFAKELGLTRQSISNKLNGRQNWTHEDIAKAVDILGRDVLNYFFDT